MQTSTAAVSMPEKFLKTVEVDVTDDENMERLKRLAVVDRKIKDTEAEKAGDVSKHNETLKQLRKEQGKLLDATTTRREERDVECYNERDDRRGFMLIKRASDGVVIDERAYTEAERNAELPFDKVKPEAPKEKTPEQLEADAAGAAAEAGAPAPDDSAQGAGGASEAPAGKAASGKSGAGKVVRIRASDVQKKKAARDAKKDRAGK